MVRIEVAELRARNDTTTASTEVLDSGAPLVPPAIIGDASAKAASKARAAPARSPARARARPSAYNGAGTPGAAAAGLDTGLGGPY